MKAQSTATLLLLASLAGHDIAQVASADQRLAPAVHAAADSLARRVDGQGRFRYRIDGCGRELAGYNVVRHAGTLWVMQDYQRRYPDAALADDLNRASRWLEQCCLRELPRWPLSALWSVPEGAPDEAKLGGAGLALAAWNGMARQNLAHPPAAALERLARFIVYLQKPDGSFHSKYRNGQRDDRWVSLYYPGEAALGLLAQYRRDPNPLWRDAAVAALRHLANSRARSGAYPADHWALIATAELADIENQVRPELAAHASAVVRGMLDMQGPGGDFGHQRRTAPTATRLEGLAAVRVLLAAADPLRAQIDAALARGSAFLLDTPLSTGAWRGAVPRAATDSPDPRRAELRIDDTQHALALWLAECARQKYSCARP